ncbi:hypothetical protein R69776_07019 [Paraburkholderia nemoris]|uniref:Secreted protein n=1 Tax=Paraburkholderia nemoris TaxID=2793076 RepID=A0ABM8SXM0_9BURK|nr:hypothetical protein R75777_01293 [Paraburkholderia nemoris]CAE6840422.1 hypothetical protein R69776_07019 [Paraburkholderia nemoris]
MRQVRKVVEYVLKRLFAISLVALVRYRGGISIYGGQACQQKCGSKPFPVYLPIDLASSLCNPEFFKTKGEPLVTEPSLNHRRNDDVSRPAFPLAIRRLAGRTISRRHLKTSFLLAPPKRLLRYLTNFPTTQIGRIRPIARSWTSRIPTRLYLTIFV